MNAKFAERVKLCAQRRGRPLRRLFADKISQNMLAEFRGHGRPIPDEEADSIGDSKIGEYLDRLEKAHDHLFVPIESPVARLEKANAAEFAKPRADGKDARPRKMELSDADRETLKGLSAEQRLAFAEGAYVAPEFQKNG